MSPVIELTACCSHMHFLHHGAKNDNFLRLSGTDEAPNVDPSDSVAIVAQPILLSLQVCTSLPIRKFAAVATGLFSNSGSPSICCCLLLFGPVSPHCRSHGVQRLCLRGRSHPKHSPPHSSRISTLTSWRPGSRASHTWPQLGSAWRAAALFYAGVQPEQPPEYLVHDPSDWLTVCLCHRS